MNNKVEHQVGDTQAQPGSDLKVLESPLKLLWERTRRAGELISQLRQEKHGLQERLSDIEQELARLKEHLSQKEDQVRKLTTDLAQQAAVDAVMFSDGDRQMLTTKVKDLLAKLEGYL